MSGLIDLEKEYFFHFQKVINHFYKLKAFQEAPLSIDLFIRLFRQVCRSVRIPFAGEPLSGLQIMGVLETRNLDFENVILLNMNEGSFPDSQHQSSFIPFNIRKAFGLPTISQQDSIYAYLFYRLIQRASTITCFYNTQSEFGLSGEPSRYLQQLKFESGINIVDQRISQPIQASHAREIIIEKNDRVLRGLDDYIDEGRKSFTPTAFSTYLNCSLQFYYRYVCKLYESDDVQESLDKALFGNILHKTMEFLYLDLQKKKKNTLVDKTDFFFLKSAVDESIRLAFEDHFNVKTGVRFDIKGRNTVLAAVVKKYVLRVLSLDEAYAPFEILALEGKARDGYALQRTVSIKGRKIRVNLKGIIDRIDQKEGLVRIIDYKSGKDSRSLKSIPSIFNPEDKNRNKAAFQLMFYSLLYQHKFGTQEKISPGLFNIREMFEDSFDNRIQLKGHGPIEDIGPWMDSFKEGLDEVLYEIFDSSIPFKQTEDIPKCSYCPYKDICGR